ncbi:ATP-binding protein [Brucepastera parasyntrophica]|uniref:ATP-binding protein n=1 Tax=Brucepastera parasyntrophica TaxID=2880008 RepID=UPI00210D5B7C|nr:ATP-binding protein [Brucepastera parasyntrophica]ULQ60383.1 ATP-binding protein [Brucepastera parasyntrophica]
MKFNYIVPGDDFSRAGNASSEMKKTLQRLGLPQAVIKRTAVAMYEAEINMVVHAGGGRAEITIEPDLITIIMKDDGPGIADIELAMQDGYSTAEDEVREMGFGAGMGLPNMKRNTDEMLIETEPGKGTTITMKIRIL